MSVSTRTFRVEAIPADVLSRIRGRGVDDLGNKVTETIDEVGGSPLRCCLRDADGRADRSHRIRPVPVARSVR